MLARKHTHIQSIMFAHFVVFAANIAPAPAAFDRVLLCHWRTRNRMRHTWPARYLRPNSAGVAHLPCTHTRAQSHTWVHCPNERMDAGNAGWYTGSNNTSAPAPAHYVCINLISPAGALVNQFPTNVGCVAHLAPERWSFRRPVVGGWDAGWWWWWWWSRFRVNERSHCLRCACASGGRVFGCGLRDTFRCEIHAIILNYSFPID